MERIKPLVALGSIRKVLESRRQANVRHRNKVCYFKLLSRSGCSSGAFVSSAFVAACVCFAFCPLDEVDASQKQLPCNVSLGMRILIISQDEGANFFFPPPKSQIKRKKKCRSMHIRLMQSHPWKATWSETDAMLCRGQNTFLHCLSRHDFGLQHDLGFTLQQGMKTDGYHTTCICLLPIQREKKAEKGDWYHWSPSPEK